MKAFLAVLFAAASFYAHAADDPSNIEERIDAILHQAFSKRFNAYQKADRDYRAAVTEAFQFADNIEVFLLDFAMGKDGVHQPKEGEGFPIRPYNTETKILKKIKVPSNQIPTWCDAVTKMVTSEKDEGGALCHYPIHGLRISAGTKLLFETSICWKCQNYYFTHDGDSTWLGLTDDANELKRLLHELMPIPETEAARFRK